MDMGNALWDIVLFAVIAGILLYRLRNVLGERSDDDPPSFTQAFQQKEAGAVIDEPDSFAQNVAVTGANGLPGWATALPNFDWVATATAHHQLTPFAAVDPGFHPQDFLDKAKKAYGMILTAYAEGNRNTLEFLLAPSLAGAFIRQIETREAAHQSYQIVTHGIQKAVIAGARLDGTDAEVTVDFITQQSITHKDANGDVIGDGDGTKRVNHDRWIFAKDLRSADPVWRLIRVEEAED